MQTRSAMFLPILVVLAFASINIPAHAQTVVSTLHNFGPDPTGAVPLGSLVQGPDGSLYGTTSGLSLDLTSTGSQNVGSGSVFKIGTDGTLTTLHWFTGGSDGGSPEAGVILGTDGNLYGTTSTGGDGAYGTVFQMSTDGTTFNTLYSFAGGADGDGPEASLVEGTDGNYYGTTAGGGGIDGNGTVFMVTPAGVLTTLYVFGGGDDGGVPQGALIQAADGNFYGTTSTGGAASAGTVFQITTGGFLTTWYTFTGGSDGGMPLSGVIQGADGNLYGTTFQGGDYGAGAVYSLSLDGTTQSTIYSFTMASDGAFPWGGLIQAPDGSFYGTTAVGGDNGYGTMFNVTVDGTLTPIYPFTGGSDGGLPVAAVIMDASGNLDGTTATGGSGYGSVFSLTTAGTLTTLHAFTGTTDGGVPQTSLIQGNDGNFYGTTVGGGANSRGTVFKVTPAGAQTIMHSFSGADGSGAIGGLVRGSDGTFYGVTHEGGANGYGSVFKMTPAGTLSTLHSFTGSDGAYPSAGLALGVDGALYGTTSGSKSAGSTAISGGTAFKVTTTGTFANLHGFTTAEGVCPLSTLVLDKDGYFYGTSSQGGTSGKGSVFRMTSTGTALNLHSFTGSDGAAPSAGLAIGSDGSLYGTTKAGGSKGHGTAFRITTAGAFTSLHSFTNALDGGGPSAALTTGLDGNLYGSTSLGGGRGNGTMFRMTTGGTLSTLHTFTGPEGAAPAAALMQTSNGVFYGATRAGGSGSGVLFTMRTAPATYTITPSAGVGGTISPPSAQTVAWGGSLTLTATPNAHCVVAQWLVDGKVAQIGGTTFTLTGITANHTVMASFAPAGAAANILVLENPNTRQVVLWSMKGTLLANALHVTPSIPAGMTVIDAADFNGDGHTDLLLQNTSTRVLTIWYLNGAAQSGAAQISAVPPVGWSVVGVGDFNGDGKPDLLLQNSSTHGIAIWYLNGPSMTLGVSVKTTAPAGLSAVGVGDFNGDGSADILFQNQSTNGLSIWYLKSGVFSAGAEVAGVPAPGLKVAAVGYLTGGAGPDIVLQSGLTGALTDLKLTGSNVTTATAFTSNPPPGWVVIGPH